MLTLLLRTTPDPMLTLLRLTLAVVILPHGAQKLFGWFGGYGFEGTMAYFASLGIPALFGFLAILAETAGGLALFVGLLGRLTAFAIGVNFVVASLLVHAQFGFFVNWYGTQAGEGIEMFLLGIAMALVLVVRGSGAWSVDRLLSGQSASREVEKAPALVASRASLG